MLASNQGNRIEPSAAKAQTKKPGKTNYNSKKSLGVKTIRTRRGQHENQSYKDSNGTGLKNGKQHVRNTDRQTSLKDGKKDSSGRDTPDEITQDKYCSLTPTWTNSPLSETGTVALKERGNLLFENNYLLSVTVYLSKIT